MEGDHSAPNNVWRDVLLPCADPPPLPLVAPAAVGAEACFASETAFCCVAVGVTGLLVWNLCKIPSHGIVHIT
jgi:hypothetical protein